MRAATRKTPRELPPKEVASGLRLGDGGDAIRAVAAEDRAGTDVRKHRISSDRRLVRTRVGPLAVYS